MTVPLPMDTAADFPRAAGVPMQRVNDPAQAVEIAKTIAEFIEPRATWGGPELLDLLAGTVLCMFPSEPDTVYLELRYPAEDLDGHPRTRIKVLVCRLRGHRWFDAGTWQVPSATSHAEAFAFHGLLREDGASAP